MPLEKPPLKRLALVVLAIVPALAWALVKPVRVIAPEWAGVTCTTTTVCVDDTSKSAEAAALYAQAVQFVDAKVSRIPGHPRVTFCSSQACADHFGLGARSAVTVGTFGTVIGPRAWKPYYVRHELIHYLQAREFGVLRLLAKPSWFVEGMAYGLSEDPRVPLSQPFEGYRSDFLAWYRSVGKDRLWAEGSRL
ncbi:hypothetical protein [Ramlibacter humi]|uniref:Uncharacterized protein n=1 Tax=Ramlibacter humi TaxID=2530451 RepID=A0A4Z0BDH6_9BURK|nr:hypothetical protein [Ramlibacter humi]TFY96164.1 hypothetical protein EZ216_21100 [Ramlibacter humi]